MFLAFLENIRGVFLKNRKPTVKKQDWETKGE